MNIEQTTIETLTEDERTMVVDVLATGYGYEDKGYHSLLTEGELLADEVRLGNIVIGESGFAQMIEYEEGAGRVREHIVSQLTSADAIQRCRLNGGRAVACALYAGGFDERVINVTEMAVLPGFRRSGIASVMLRDHIAMSGRSELIIAGVTRNKNFVPVLQKFCEGRSSLHPSYSYSENEELLRIARGTAGDTAFIDNSDGLNIIYKNDYAPREGLYRFGFDPGRVEGGYRLCDTSDPNLKDVQYGLVVVGRVDPRLLQEE